jgi:hypothetical protein
MPRTLERDPEIQRSQACAQAVHARLLRIDDR